MLMHDSSGWPSLLEEWTGLQSNSIVRQCSYEMKFSEAIFDSQGFSEHDTQCVSVSQWFDGHGVKEHAAMVGQR